MRSQQLPVPGGAVESGATPKQDNRAPACPASAHGTKTTHRLRTIWCLSCPEGAVRGHIRAAIEEIDVCADSGVRNPSRNDETKFLPHWLAFTVLVGAGIAGGELFGFPWWLRLITVVAVAVLLQGVNEIVGRACSKKRLEGHPGHRPAGGTKSGGGGRSGTVVAHVAQTYETPSHPPPEFVRQSSIPDGASGLLAAAPPQIENRSFASSGRTRDRKPPVRNGCWSRPGRSSGRGPRRSFPGPGRA